MKKIFLILLLSVSSSYAIETTNINTTTDGLNCNARVSNVQIERQINVQVEQGFCTASLIDASTVITAAHCLNEAVDGRIANLNDIPSGVYLNMAIGSEVTSQRYELKSGSAAAVYSNELATFEQRQELVRRNTVEKVQHDLVILKLKQPIANIDTSSCPRLPTIVECTEFNRNFVNNSSRNINEIAGTYYISGEHSVGDGLRRVTATYPLNRMVNLTATSFAKHNTLDHLIVSFENRAERQNARFKKGDSGAGLMWERAGRKTFIGVQSAASKDDASSAHFANICNFNQHPNWPR